jgi:hypothetical protein
VPKAKHFTAKSSEKFTEYAGEIFSDIFRARGLCAANALASETHASTQRVIGVKSFSFNISAENRNGNR